VNTQQLADEQGSSIRTDLNQEYARLASEQESTLKDEQTARERLEALDLRRRGRYGVAVLPDEFQTALTIWRAAKARLDGIARRMRNNRRAAMLPFRRPIRPPLRHDVSAEG
jgi:hypothetical protein